MWITRSKDFKTKIALTDSKGSISYQALYQEAIKIASFLLNFFQTNHLQERRIAFLYQATREYVALQWGVWLSGGIAVPLSPLHPIHEINYVLQDADCSLILTELEFLPMLDTLEMPLILYGQIFASECQHLPDVSLSQQALI